MSELVEQVAQKMVDAYEAQFGTPDHVTDGMKSRWKAFEPEARAAIAAVAEWMIDEFSYQAEMIEIKQAMVATLRAAAGSAPTPPEVK